MLILDLSGLGGGVVQRPRQSLYLSIISFPNLLLKSFPIKSTSVSSDRGIWDNPTTFAISLGYWSGCFKVSSAISLVRHVGVWYNLKMQRTP